MNREFKQYIPHVFLILSFLFESLEGQTRYFLGSSYGLTFILKSIVLVYFFSVSFLVNKKIYAWLGLLFVLFVVSQFSYAQFEFDILKNFHMFINYMYPFVLILGLSKLIGTSNVKSLQTIYLIGISVLLCSIIIGAVFNLPSLTTYSYRFGFKGFLPSAATVSYFIILCWIVVLQKEWQTKYTTFLLVLLVLASFLAGTKAALFYLVFVCIHLLKTKQFYISWQKFTLGTIGLVSLLGIVYTVYQEKFLVTQKIFSTLYTEENIFSALSSFRTRKLIENTAYYAEYWNPINYFVGGRHVFIENFELDFLDVLLHFGIAGGIIYIFVAKQLFLPLLSYSKNYILFIGLLVIASLAGQFFYNTYMNLLLIYFLLLQRHLQQTSTLD